MREVPLYCFDMCEVFNRECMASVLSRRRKTPIIIVAAGKITHKV
jgi:hypothetical protein